MIGEKVENALLVVQGMSFVGMIVALILALNSLSETNQSRYNSRYDSCYLLRSIILETTPPNHTKQALQFIATTPLANCLTYAATNK